MLYTDAALEDAPDADDHAVKAWSRGEHVVMGVETRGGSLGGRPQFNVLGRPSRKMRRVCRSSHAAVAFEACDAIDMAAVSRAP